MRWYWVHHWDWRNKILCYWNRYDFVMFPREGNAFSTEFLSKYWTEIWEIWRTDLRPGFEVLLNFITDVGDSSQFARQTNVFLEDSQEHAMTQILIWDCRHWRFCWEVDWFPDSSIDAIIVARERGRFAMANRYDFGSSLEQIGWFQCRCSEKKFHWYDDSGSGF